MANLNLETLDKLLTNATSSNKKIKPPLWRLLAKDMDRIEAAKQEGETYKAMAEAVGVTAHSFSIALSKARLHLKRLDEAKAAEIKKETEIQNENKETEAEIVVIHDTARPFATRDMFKRVSNLEEYDGKIVAIPSRDTLKEVAENIVIKTIDRSGIWLAQTPQAFKRKTLIECHFKARNEGFYGTDDASLLERYGYKVGIVEGSFWNFKITFPEDLEIAERFVGGGGGTRTLTGL